MTTLTRKEILEKLDQAFKDLDATMDNMVASIIEGEIKDLQVLLAKTVEYVNCTPHAISLNDGAVFYPSGAIARCQASFSSFVDGICRQQFGEIQNLPAPQPGVRYIVSAMVLSALNGSRPDVVAPATGHPDCIRIDGQIRSVPGFVQ